MGGGDRQKDEGTPGLENPGSDRDLIAQVEDGKGRATGRGKVDTGSREELLGLPIREESVDERWSLAGGDAVQVNGCSAPRRDGGGYAGEKRERSGVGR